jgi:hypothetical protein
MGIYLMCEAAFTLISGFWMYKSRWHPIAALVASFILFGLWTSGAALNAIIIASVEVGFVNLNNWYKLCYAEVGFQASMAILYAVMMGFSGNAVHMWRKSGGKHEYVESV